MKYFKITQDRECPQGDPSKDPCPTWCCGKNGTYFKNEDILISLNIGNFIQSVDIPSGVEVSDAPSWSDTFIASKVILGPRKDLRLSDTWGWLTSVGVDIHCHNDWALRWAAVRGYLDVVRYLVEDGANIHSSREDALFHAASNGHLPVVKYLVEHGAEVCVENLNILKQSLRLGHTDVFNYLKEAVLSIVEQVKSLQGTNQ